MLPRENSVLVWVGYRKQHEAEYSNEWGGITSMIPAGPTAKAPIYEIFNGCKTALEDEIRAAKKIRASRIYLSEGRLLSSRQTTEGTKFIYSFTADSEIRFPDDTPIELRVGERDISGELISSAGFDAIVALSADLGKDIAQASLSSTPWFLLDRLKQRIEDLSNMQAGQFSLIEQLVGIRALAKSMNRPETDTILEHMQTRLGVDFRCNELQRNAVKKVATSPISLIWGPPGTGKTNTLGLAVNLLIGFGDTALISAHSNAAVDRAAVSIAKHLPRSLYESGRILRIGITTDEELQEYPMLTVRGILAKQQPELIAQLDKFESQLRDLTKRARSASLPEPERAKIQADVQVIKLLLDPIRVQLREEERVLIQNASVIACTLSKATIMQEIGQRIYSAVVIDEASMAYIPHCLLVTSFATHKACFFGDFRQLGPISSGNTEATKRWLEKDIFEVANVIEHLKTQTRDPRLAMLCEQYRMNPTIARVVSEMFYIKLLKDSKDVAARTEPAMICHPFPGSPLSACNLSRIRARCFTDIESLSSFNLISALFTIQLARQALQSTEKQVGVITPYNAQSRLLNRLLRDMGISNSDIKASTVHKFQGSERTTIVFDPVDNTGKEKPGRLLQGGQNTSAMRLTNVAISRAASKFIAVIDPGYFAAKLSDKDSFGSAMKRVTQDGYSEFASLSSSSQAGTYKLNLEEVKVFRNSSDVKPLIAKDLAAAQEHVTVSWPSPVDPAVLPLGFLNSCAQNKILSYFTNKGRDSNSAGVTNARVWDNNLNTAYGIVAIDRNILGFTQNRSQLTQ